MTTEAIVPRETGQWFDSADGQHWWFDSSSLALDFAYTGAMGDNPAWEQLHSPVDLGAWLADRFAGIDAAARDGDLTDALALRAAIAHLANAAAARDKAEREGDHDGDLPDTPSAEAVIHERADDVDTVNLFAATPDIPPVLPGGNRQAGRGVPRANQALSTIARDAVRLFSAESGGRIRECSADDCSIIYLDTSRSGNRRWCSMRRCGNRAKVRAHRARIH